MVPIIRRRRGCDCDCGCCCCCCCGCTTTTKEANDDDEDKDETDELNEESGCRDGSGGEVEVEDDGGCWYGVATSMGGEAALGVVVVFQ